MGLVYVGLAPLPADPCAKGPSGWNPYFTFPGPPWAPGWPVTVASGFSLGLSLGTVNVGAAALLVASVLFNGIDDATLKCHSLSITGTLNGGLMQLSTDGVTFSNSLAGTVTNYSGSSYGKSVNLSLPLSGGDVGKSGSITVCVTSTNPPICATVNFTVIAAATQRAYQFSQTDIEQFTVGTNSWAVKSTHSNMARNSFGFNIGAYGYQAGGSTGTTRFFVNRFDPALNSWAALSSLPNIQEEGAGLTMSQIGYCFGGIVLPGDNSYQYTPASDSWASKTTMITPRYLCAGGAVGVYGFIFGGFLVGGTTVTSANERYDSGANAWASKTVMSAGGWASMPGTTISGKCYVFAGNNGAQLQRCDQYDPAGDAWSSKANLPNPVRDRASACTVGILGYVYGGRNGGSSIADTDEFDPVGNAFTAKSGLSAVQQAGCGVAIAS